MNKIVNINFQCKARPTALHTDVIHNYVEVAALLLERRADMMIAPLKKCVKNESECTLLCVKNESECTLLKMRQERIRVYFAPLMRLLGH